MSRIPEVRGRLKFRNGWAMATVKVGDVIVNVDSVGAWAWRTLLADLQRRVEAFRIVASTGQKFKPWDDLTDEEEL